MKVGKGNTKKAIQKKKMHFFFASLKMIKPLKCSKQHDKHLTCLHLILITNFMKLVLLFPFYR